MKKIIALGLLGSCLFANAQQTKMLTAEKHNEYGLVYSLPTTAFQIDIVAVKEVKVAGPFSRYSKIFTANPNVISHSEVNWTIESVRVTPYGIPDPENQYLMQLKAGSPTFISVADDGMLVAINKEVRIPEISPVEIQEINGTPVSGKEYLEYVDEDFIAAKSSFKQAQILAEEIMEVRDAKVSLTRGTAETMPTDGKQLEIMLASLDEQEKALTSAFIGNSWKEKTLSSFTFVPQKNGKYMLCRLNTVNGIIDADEGSGEPVYVSVHVTRKGELPVDAKGVEKKIPKDAVVYCIPGTAELSVSFSDNNLFEEDFEMSQFGMVFGLNPSIFTDKKEPSYAIFDPNTGALKELGTLKP